MRELRCWSDDENKHLEYFDLKCGGSEMRVSYNISAGQGEATQWGDILGSTLFDGDIIGSDFGWEGEDRWDYPLLGRTL